MTFVDVLNQLAEAILTLKQSCPRRVALDGIDAAGKTTLADALGDYLRAMGTEVIRASVDGFQQPQAVRRQRGSLSPEGYYFDAFDYATFTSDLLVPLGREGNRRYRTAAFDLQTDRPIDGGWQVATDDAVLIVDGVFLQRPELDAYWDVRIWVDVSFAVSLERACTRDLAVFGSVDVVRERYAKRYIPGQQLYLEACHPQRTAQWVVDNSDPLHPSLYRTAS